MVDHEKHLVPLASLNPLKFENDPDFGSLMSSVSHFNGDFRGEMRRIGVSGQIVDRVRSVQEEYQACFCFRMRVSGDHADCPCCCRYCIDDCAAKGVGYLVDKPCVSIPSVVYSEKPDPDRQLLLDRYDRNQVCEIAARGRMDTKFLNVVRGKVSGSFRTNGRFYHIRKFSLGLFRVTKKKLVGKKSFCEPEFEFFVFFCFGILKKKRLF